MILAGDIGGTKTTFALYEDDAPHSKARCVQHYHSQEYPHFFAILDHYLQAVNQDIHVACFSVAGPVFEGHCQTLNLPWLLDADKITQRYHIKKVFLLNDLQATAYGALVLPETEKVLLNPDQVDLIGAPPSGNRAVIAPGTGLGEALLYWDGSKYHPSASEGGHSDFAPRNALEIALLKFLFEKYAHVSYERLLSGPGLFTLYQFMKIHSQGDDDPVLTERLTSEDSAALISELALSQSSTCCVKTLDLFVSILGAEAGNLALKALATGGIYLGGGIVPKILPKLKDGTFIRAFVEKGRYSALLSKIPVWLISDPQTALHGAAYYATSKNKRR